LIYSSEPWPALLDALSSCLVLDRRPDPRARVLRRRVLQECLLVHVQPLHAKCHCRVHIRIAGQCAHFTLRTRAADRLSTHPISLQTICATQSRALSYPSRAGGQREDAVGDVRHERYNLILPRDVVNIDLEDLEVRYCWGAGGAVFLPIGREFCWTRPFGMRPGSISPQDAVPKGSF